MAAGIILNPPSGTVVAGYSAPGSITTNTGSTGEGTVSVGDSWTISILSMPAGITINGGLRGKILSNGGTFGISWQVNASVAAGAHIGVYTWHDTTSGLNGSTGFTINVSAATSTINPVSMVLSPTSLRLYVLDTGRKYIWVFDTSQPTGQGLVEHFDISSITVGINRIEMSVSNENLWLSDGNQTVYSVNGLTGAITTINQSAHLHGTIIDFGVPYRNSYLYLADTGSYVTSYDPNGSYLVDSASPTFGATPMGKLTCYRIFTQLVGFSTTTNDVGFIQYNFGEVYYSPYTILNNPVPFSVTLDAQGYVYVTAEEDVNGSGNYTISVWWQDTTAVQNAPQKYTYTWPGTGFSGSLTEYADHSLNDDLVFGLDTLGNLYKMDGGPSQSYPTSFNPPLFQPALVATFPTPCVCLLSQGIGEIVDEPSTASFMWALGESNSGVFRYNVSTNTFDLTYPYVFELLPSITSDSSLSGELLGAVALDIDLVSDSSITADATVHFAAPSVSITGTSGLTGTLTESFHALVVVSDDTTLTLSFAPYLDLDDATDLRNYVITPLDGAPLIGLLSATPVLFDGALSGVVLQTAKQTNGARYSITVSGLNISPGDPYVATATFTAVATRPQVVGASYLGNGQVVVTFSIAMRPDEYLTSPSEFSVTGPTSVEVTRVQTVSPTQVVLYTNGLGSGSYTVTVNTSGTPHDIGGNPVDPAYATAVFISTPPITQRSIFTDKGPIAKPPNILQSGINALIVRPALTFDLQPHKDLTTLTLPGASVTSAMVGLYVTLTGSSLNDGTYMITFVLSPTSVRVNANFHLPDVMNGSMNWSVVDPRNGQIADSPSDVSVTVNGVGVIPTDVIGLLGQVVLATPPADGDTVLVNYSWVNNPTMDFCALNDPQFRLNSWNRDVGYPSEVQHHYRYNNQLVVPSDYNSQNIQSTLAQPEQRDLKYRAYERAYTPVLNDPNLLTLNNPIHKIAFPPMSRETASVFVSYGATILPENDPVAPWTRTGVGTTSLAGDLLTVTKTVAGPFPTGQVLFWNRQIDLTFPAVFAAAWRMYITATPTTEGVFTGVVMGYSDGKKAIVVGFLLVGGVAQIGILQSGGDDPSVLSSWAGGLDASGNPTGAPVVFDWTTIHSYRLYEDTTGNIYLYIDGNVVETLLLPESETPFLEELSAPFNELQGVFFGSLSRMAVNTSVWEFVRYNIIPTNPIQTTPSVFVTYEGNVTPETSAQPWTPIGSAGTETILGNTYLVVDSTSATDEVTEEAAGLISGDFRGYDRIEPLLQVSSDVVLDLSVQLRTYTHGITPNAVMAAVDDGTYLVQLCFFPDQASPKLSYGGRSLPTDFTPYTWSSMGGQTAAMFGRYLRITDTSVTDGLVYFVDDEAPVGSTARVVSSTTDYMLEFRARVESFTADVTTGFCGVNSDVYDGLRDVGIMLTTVSGVPNVTFHSEGVGFANIPFNWNDGKYHTYRLVKNTSGNLVTLFIDTTFVGSTNYSNFSIFAGTQVGVVSFGSASPSTSGSLSVVDWMYCNCWRVLPSVNRYVGVWKGTTTGTLTDYHLPLKAQGTTATVSNNALGDASTNFVAAGVQVGDYIVIDSGPNEGMYSIASVSTTVLTITTTFPFGPTQAAYRVPAQTDWTTSHRYRVVRNPSGGISVLLDSTTAPLIILGYNEIDLPSSQDGVPWVVNGGLPGIVWGAFDPTNLSQTSWNFVKYGITRNPGTNRIVPPHQVLNQNNVIASYERQLSNLPHTVTDFWSGSTGIPPELEPDFLTNPSLVAYTLLNEGTPLVPSTQTFEVRKPTPMSVPIASLNSPNDVLNTQTFVLNNADFETILLVPDDVLYNSLQVIETDTGTPNLIAPFDDMVTTLGTLSFQNEVCLIYDAQTLPEDDTTAVTPWSFQADDPTHVQRSVFNGVLTFGTDNTGTRAIYRNATPLPDAVSLTTQVTFRLKLLSDASYGLGDTQVRFGMSATNMTLALGFVTSPLGQRYLLVYDQNTGAVIGGRPFDFLDGNYHQFRVLRNPGAGTVSIFIDS